MTRLFFYALFILTGLSPDAVAMENNTNRPGQDYASFNLSSPTPGYCEARCNHDARCKAWTYVKPGVQGPQARCWLKSGIPAPRPSTCCSSGVHQFYRTRWDKIGGGGAWSTGWNTSQLMQACRHYSAGCSCPGHMACGLYGNGQEALWWPDGCSSEPWRLRCTAVPE